LKKGTTVELLESFSKVGNPYQLIFKGNLISGTEYVLSLTSNSAFSAVGSYGPVKLQTQSSANANAVVYARNPSFGNIYLTSAPPALTFTAGYNVVSTNNNMPSKSVAVYVDFSSLGISGKDKLEAPWSITIELTEKLFSTLGSVCS